MRLIFAGTPDFAASALQALIDAGHEIVLVLTQPDRPAGRGMKLKPSPVKNVALQHALPVAQPLSLKNAEAEQLLRSVGADVMVVAAYGLILPQAVLAIPPRGCINIHGSLLPRWRGAAPVQRAIQSGDQVTGITTMQMDAGLDTGAMLARYPLAIAADETSASLFAKLTELGAQAIVETLSRLDEIVPEPQSEEGVTYAHKLTREESRLDWSRPADELARSIRAFNPAPGMYSLLGGEVLKCWQADCSAGQAPEGCVVAADAAGVLVGTGYGLLRMTELQMAGGRRLAAREFAVGRAGLVGTILG